MIDGDAEDNDDDNDDDKGTLTERGGGCLLVLCVPGWGGVSPSPTCQRHPHPFRELKTSQILPHLNHPPIPTADGSQGVWGADLTGTHRLPGAWLEGDLTEF